MPAIHKQRWPGTKRLQHIRLAMTLPTWPSCARSDIIISSRALLSLRRNAAMMKPSLPVGRLPRQYKMTTMA